MESQKMCGFHWATLYNECNFQISPSCIFLLRPNRTSFSLMYYVGTCEASRLFEFESAVPFNSKVIGRFENFRIESAVPAPLLVVSLSQTTRTINGT